MPLVDKIATNQRLGVVRVSNGSGFIIDGNGNITADVPTLQSILGVPGGGALTVNSVAAAGVSQVTSTPLTGLVNLITSGTGGVTVSPIVNQIQYIYNATNTSVTLYPLSNMSFGLQSQNTAITVNSDRCVSVLVVSATQAYIVGTTTSFG